MSNSTSEKIKAAVAARQAEMEAGAPGQPQRPPLRLNDWVTTTAFTGPVPVREYLVGGIFPMGQVSLLGAAGGVGKSFGLTAMSHDVARSSQGFVFHFGGALLAGGKAIYLSGEDDSIEAHSRIATLGGPLDDLVFVPFASAGGAPTFFRSHPVTREPVPTQEWMDIRGQIVAMKVVVVVIDPLQVFCTLDLNQPENAQFVCSQLSALAAETGAAVIISHHFRKGGVSSPETAREAIRGTAGLVDGVRAVYALWMPSGDSRERGNPKAICRKLHVQYAPGKIVNGAIVKANGKADTKVYTFLREDDGRLTDVTTRLGWLAEQNLDAMLTDAIARAASEGKPYTKTGQTGLWERRAEMEDPFHHLSKHRFTEIVDQLLQENKVVAASAKGSAAVKWLDVPDGSFASGNGEFVPGHVSPKSRV